MVAAFWSLHGDRSQQGPIHFVAIDAYARRYGISGADFGRFEAHIRTCDATYLEHEAARRKAELEKQKQEAARNRR